jgi:hypothetical protein
LPGVPVALRPPNSGCKRARFSPIAGFLPWTIFACIRKDLRGNPQNVKNKNCKLDLCAYPASLYFQLSVLFAPNFATASPVARKLHARLGNAHGIR